FRHGAPRYLIYVILQRRRAGCPRPEMPPAAPRRLRLRRRTCLFDGHGLREVAWLVDIESELGRGVVGEQLERDRQQHRVELRLTTRHVDAHDGIESREAAQVDAGVSDDDEGAAASTDLVQGG